MNKFVKNYGQKYFDQLPTLAECLVEIIQSNGIKDMYGVGGDYAKSGNPDDIEKWSLLK